MTLPARRKQARSGIERAPKREWPRHRAFVRSHLCCVPGCQSGPIEFAHWRAAWNAGVAIKSADWHGISLCSDHHREQHQIGQTRFEVKYGISMEKLAAEFAERSPDVLMRQVMKESQR